MFPARPAIAILITCWAGHCLRAELPPTIDTFLSANCLDCHNADTTEGGLNLQSLPAAVDRSDVASRWERILSRVEAGEMPPPEDAEVEAAEASAFTKSLGDWIRHEQRLQSKQTGRVAARQLTNLQLERSLHDLLGIDLPLTMAMADEQRSGGFTNIAETQSISHFQLEQHLRIVDLALDEAFRRALTPPDEWSKRMPAKEIVRTNPKRRTREPELIDGQAVTWSSRLIYYGRLPATTAKQDGWYRFTLQASALKTPEDRTGVWCTIRSGPAVSSAPLLAWVGAFEATDKPKQITVEAWLNRGEMLEIRPGDLTLKGANFAGGQVGTGEGGPQNVPGVAIDWIEMERFHPHADDDEVRKLLFNEHPVKSHRDPAKAEVTLDNPKEDIGRLLAYFARRAFRRPVPWSDVVRYVDLAIEKLDESGDPIVALRTGYRALLCSPRFLYFEEQPGPLDDHAIAARLSYMLQSTTPDETLMKLAAAGKLRNRQVLLQQIDRLLEGPAGQQFVRDFADQWLDLHLIDFTEPDRRLYPGFDVIVQQSMLDETHRFLEEMLREDLPVGNLIDSEFTFLNSRLAHYYKIDGATSDNLEKVALQPKDRRGGLLTHGSIMKVTANGTATSPVIRGVWISERLLGQEIPPPPESIPAIEPDVRGAKSIRDLLAKHTSDASCASCHRDIDPPGFALENFDPSGRWRTSYGKPRGKKKLPPIDASFTMPNGKKFQDLQSFQDLVLEDPERLAANVVDKLVAYGTGGEPRFADREAVEQIVQQTASSQYGFRSLIEATITSSLFLSK
ncbi:Planctomycete cytochrome C [Rosistilla carotiformis]|uniref:Planctomycete cytochrome C n=1 Tax=Rosistilla carotiformis TaxID=2528017 RepID=A0A518JW01_9BACT|nr:DUF1592 domain-containing protein [Rosistilla carotiformis]QDV69726.1 Planctomycete cytochrome C [Rosistilla carotiformis]